MTTRGWLILKALGALVALWVAVWGFLKVAGFYEVTPEKIVTWVEERPIAEVDDPGERRKWLKQLAGKMNQLDYEQRRLFREGERGSGGARRPGPGGGGFWEGLDKEERRYFIDLTIGEAFKQMMRGFNEMEAEERREFVARARRDIEKQEGDRRELARLEEEDEEIYDKIVSEGLEAYYRDANADTKRDLAPLMEEMQRQMQNPHRRQKKEPVKWEQ